MQQADAVAFQSLSCVPNAGDVEQDFVNRWSTAEQAIRKLPPLGNTDAEPHPLSGGAQIRATQIAASDVFRTVFGLAPANFASVKIDRLIAVQKYVDSDHVDSLVPPAETDESAVLDFCMKANPIDPPLIGPDGAITFSSHYSQNLVPLNPGFRAVDDHKIEVTATIISRPNYLQVAQIGNRYVVTNGYHRAVALLNAGHTRLPCLLKAYPMIEATGLTAPGYFDSARVNSGRPPLVSDFRTTAGNFTDLEIRARNHILRVGFTVNAFEAPR